MKEYQSQLIQSERMAALGEMVAGIAHEINTPIGIGFTSATYLKNQTRKFAERFDGGHLTKELLRDYLEIALESSTLIETNLRRAAQLINSFKMVAVDQTSQESRPINLATHLHEIIPSLRPRLKNTRHLIEINCTANQPLVTHPGAISQILTNLVMNSLIHGFEGMDQGRITIDVSIHEDEVRLVYQDNGRGINADGVKRLFEPFFTTRRGQGGAVWGCMWCTTWSRKPCKGRFPARVPSVRGFCSSSNSPGSR
ncbi:MAG: HAMP domain-containing histidine kinase [Magnetococcales bacterium]|nr:HAMP domain-containing histidine kinase [Magnetococcales bacterium]MBF0348450.1 HAMP domain-containing histidine kinase [Magnetococcales bacterium]MBF0632510.1 HAMP domain-containing histidine kinase [Magnetococcales bacterium]